MLPNTKRFYLLDNLKFFLVILVIFGHILRPFIADNDFIKAMYLMIYAFHMPLFALISGMFAKTEITYKEIRKYAETLLIPFLCFQFLYELFNFLMTGELSNFSINFQAYWILWFLLSLFCWKIMFTIYNTFNRTFAIILVFLLPLLFGFSEFDGNFLSISKTFVFFPFFFIGHFITSDMISKLKFRNHILVYSALLFGIFLVFLQFSEINHKWLLGNYSYFELGYSDWSAILIRTAFYIVSFSLCFYMLGLMSKSKTIVTRFGENTIYVFLWHGFIVKILAQTGIMVIIQDYNLLLFVVVTAIISTVSAFLLATNFVKEKTNNYIFRPISRLLLRKTD